MFTYIYVYIYIHTHICVCVYGTCPPNTLSRCIIAIPLKNYYIYMHAYIYIYICIYSVGDLQWACMMLSSCLAELVFTPHFSIIVEEVKSSAPTHVVKLCFVVSKGMLIVRYFPSNRDSFLCQSNFIKIIRLSQS